MHFSLQRLLSRSDSCSPFPSTRSATLSSYRFSLASPFSLLFLAFGQRQIPREPRYSWSVEGCFSLPASLGPPPSRYLRLPFQCLLRLLPSCPHLSFFTFILYGITSGDDGIPESKTRSFEFVEILKDVVDLLSSTVLQLPRFQAVQFSFPSHSLTLPSPAIGLLQGCSS